MKDEIWKPISNHEGWYEVSSMGRIKRVKKGSGAIHGRILKPSLNLKGYLFVVLSKNNIRSIKTVHSLVAQAFISDRPKGLQINHIDAVKINNKPSNLEYVTHLENLMHSQRNGLHQHGEKHGMAKLKDRDVLEIRELLSKGVRACEITKIYNASNQTIHSIKTRATWKHLTEGGC